MNASLWQLAGWTMIHSLWLGAAVALAGGFLRLACRRASPNTRYAISLGTLALLAATPIAAAGWLSVNGVPAIETTLLPLNLGEGWGEGQAQVHALNHPSLTLPLKGREPEEGSESPRPAVVDLAHATPAELDALAAQAQPAAPPIPHSALPLHPSDHRSPITSHLSPVIPHLPTLWLIGAPLTFALLATGLVGSERLRRRATPLTAGPAYDACQRLRQTLTITRRVALAVCDDVAQPILVGIVRPLILLPTAALAGWTPEQLDMVLLHELAHVRRWDNLVNLLQRIVESLLFFHPAVWLVSRQVRRDREECCDAAVIRHTDRPEAYATLLIDIASRLRLSGQLSPAQSLTVASAMASHPLAGRIRRILNIEAEPMRIPRRTLAATLLLPLLLAGAIFYSGASAEDSPPVKPGSPGSPNQGGAATESISEETQSTAKASPGSAAPVQEPEPSAKSGENETAPENDADSFAANYPIKPDTQIDLFDLVRSLGGHNLKLDMVAGEWVISLNAPKQAHNRLKVLLGDPTLPQPAAAPSSNLNATSSSRPNDDLNASVDIANLKNEIRKFEDLAAKAQQELVDLEVFKELSAQSGPGRSSGLEEAIAEDLAQDPTIKTYMSQLVELNATLQTKLTESKSPNTPEIKRLRAVIQQAEAEMAKYQGEVSRTLREKYAHLPKNAKLAAEREYKIRRLGVEVELAEYQQQLLHSKQMLAEANAQLGVPQAIGTYATPTIAAAGAIQRQIKNEQPTASASHDAGAQVPPPEPSAQSDSNSPQADLRTVLAETKGRIQRQLADLKAHAAETQGSEAEKAAISALEAKVLEWEVMSKAWGPSSPANPSDAATGSNADNAGPTSQASLGSAAPVQEPEPPAYPTPAMSTNSQSNSNEIEIHFPPGFPDSDQERERIRKSLEAEGFKAFHKASQYGDRLTHSLHVNIPNGLPAKPVWESRPEGMVVRIINEPAGSPGSQNQGGEATGSEPDMARTSNQASPDSTALFQEPKPPTNLTPDSAPPPTHPALLRGLASLEQLSQGPTTAEIQRAFLVRPDNPEVTHKYDVFPSMRKGIADRFERLATQSPGRHVNVKWEWIDGNTRIQVIAPEEAHQLLFDRPRAGEPIDLLHQPTSPSPFPTLEKQKIADRAYKLLGLELEPLTPEELERVKKLGYNGGLRVAAFDPHKKNGIGLDALLVGLHVWPITDLQSLDAVLTREDLDDLSPLRFRTVVKASDSPLKQPEDRIISGRMPIDVNAFRSIQRSLPPTHANAAAMLNGPAPPAGNAAAVTVVQPPVSSISGPTKNHTQTTAYLKISFNRDANARLTPQEIERNFMNCLAIVKSPSVLKAALKSFKPQDAQDLWQDQAIEALQNRLSATFPGDGEILELKLEGGDAKEDAILLQAVIDAFLAALKAPPESPADPNAATKLNENAADALDPFANLAPSSSPDEVDGPPTATYLYDGKTFDQWRDLWKLELNPERRTEAINALAAFGRTGHGQEAADAILEVAGEYGDDYSRGSPEGKLLEAIRLAVSRMPASQWMPQVQQRIAAAGPNQGLWIRHAGSFLGATRDSSDEARQLAAKFAEIAGDELLTATALYLWRNDQDYAQPQTIEIMRRALQQDPPGIDIAFLGFRHLDKVPEQLDVLLRSGHARRRLEEHAEKDKGLSARLSPALLEVLQNPDRANDHVGALRALRALATARRSLETTEDRLNISKELIEQLRTAPDELLPAALVTGAKLSGFADNEAALKSLQEQGLLTPERIEHLRNLDEQSLFEEANAE